MTENGMAIVSRVETTPERGGFTREQVDLIKRTIAADATDDELQMFIAQAQRMGLDPFAKQIYFVKRQGKGTIQVGIDGYRLVADRTGKYAGNDDPVYEYGETQDRPTLARVTVWKLVQGQRCPFTATARWAEYVPEGGQGFMWKKMPHVMLGKVAEALALRKAFPAELSGTYVDAEMDQADAPHVAAAQPAPRPAPQSMQPAQPKPQPAEVNPSTREAVTPMQLRAIYKIAWDQMQMGGPEVDEKCVALYGSIPQEISKRQASDFISALQTKSV